MILIDISGASAVIRKQDVLTQGMAGATVTFRFDESWDGFSKTAVFRGGDITKDVTDIADTVTIPWEVLLAGVPVCIGVYGIKGEIVLPTVWARTNPVLPGADPSGDESADPTLPIWAKMQETVNSIREDADAGKFIGPPGPKGDAGVVEFIVVAQLPTQDIKNAIYLVPAKDADGSNLFAEYIYVDGKWEQIGSASVEINLEEFVKKTDYATADNTGVVRIGPGLKMAGAILQIYKASDGGINSRASDYNPIVPSNLDYAVRASLTNPKNVTWTDENKSSARETLGAASDANTVKQVQYDNSYKYPGGSDGTYYGLAYARKFDDTECCFPITGQNRNFTIPIRDHTGNFYVNTPTLAYHCTTKGYVDNLTAELTERIAELESKLAAQ